MLVVGHRADYRKAALARDGVSRSRRRSSSCHARDRSFGFSMTPDRGTELMRNRIKTIGVTVAALSALALGGSAIASATQHAARHSTPAAQRSVMAEKSSAVDGDKVQAGDQSSPDLSAAQTRSASASETPDAGSTGESSSESDGPGGHEDPEGNVEFQSEGQE
jgi:hypothetical protein